MLPALPMTTALDFNPQLNPLSDQISQINHNQSRVTWKDRIVSVLPLALSAVMFGALWVAGVSTLIAGAAAFVTFAGAYIVIKLVARKVQLAPPKSLLSPQNPLNVADATVPAPKKPVSNDGQQTQHQVDVLKSDARIQSKSWQMLSINML